MAIMEEWAEYEKTATPETIMYDCAENLKDWNDGSPDFLQRIKAFVAGEADDF